MRQEPNIILKKNKPKLFVKEVKLDQITSQESSLISEPIFGKLVNSNNFISRQKYSMKNFVIADFSSIQNNFKLNKLYTTVMIGVSLTTFIFLTYGLSSSFTTAS